MSTFLPSQMYPIVIEKLKDFTDQEDHDPTLIKHEERPIVF
nr:hypothetical protein [Odoribacter splanchnicus]